MGDACSNFTLKIKISERWRWKMKKAIMVLFAILALAISSTAVMAAKACTTIQDGTLYTSDGRLITPGYDIWSYNYQARMFNGGHLVPLRITIPPTVKTRPVIIYSYFISW